jgi:3-oxoadipate enol-lactonase
MPIVRSDNADIYYEEAGSGDAILFAHGAGGNAAIWFEQVAAFADRYRCITFDHRVFARSPADPETISTPQFCADALAVLDALAIDRAHLVGQSMGGFTCLRLLLDHPDRVASLTLSCTSGGLPNSNPSPAMRGLTSSSGQATSGVIGTMSEKTAQDQVRLQLYEAINSFNTQFSWEHLRGLRGPDLAELAAIVCPVLFISGAEDPLFPTDLLASYVPHFPNARLEVVSDAGHSPYFEQPQAFNSLLQTFIESAA